MEKLRKLHINLPLIEVIHQILNYFKFMKDILTKWRRVREFEIVALAYECCRILQGRLPPKMKDLGCFTISCTI